VRKATSVRTVTLLSVALLVIITATVACAQATWEGPTGVFLNPLALDLAKGQTAVSIHYLNLEPAGGLTTYGLAYGAFDNFEVGLTRADLSAGGLTSLDILHAKYVWPGQHGAPNLALGAILRDTEGSGGANTNDFYLAATKIFPAKTPVIASVTVRNTNGLGSGLFGKDTDRSFQLGAFLGVQVTPKLILGAEYYDQPEADAWLDLAARYFASPNTTIDVGLARINDTFDDQFALAVTHVF
jgi:hypothetical protein